jgi:hypothetical protein
MRERHRPTRHRDIYASFPGQRQYPLKHILVGPLVLTVHMGRLYDAALRLRRSADRRAKGERDLKWVL